MSAASDLANTLSVTLLAGTDFSVQLPDFSNDDFKVPVPDMTGPLYSAIPKLKIEDLTAGSDSLSGSGAFDELMKGFKAHLKGEFDAGRISGSEYTKAYIACTEAAMAQGVQFLLGRDSSYWAAVNAQLQARAAEVQVVTARVQLETEKTRLQVLRIEALNQQVTYALNKIRLAGESIQFDAAEYNLENVLPRQKELLQEQIEAQRAQTLDTRTDGGPVTGSVGKQKELYSQQITSYQRDAENKAAKIFTDAWTVMKTIDEGLAPPIGFANANLNDILSQIKTKNGLGDPVI